MGSENASCPVNAAPGSASNSDEYFLQHSLVFAESLKDLRNLKIQLYSAAEYFESSYKKHEYKQLVVETMKDYASKALISTVDHLGSVACKVDSFLNEKVNEISAARLQFSGLEQKLRSCRGFIDHNGLLQQSLVINTPKHYKRYKIPVVAESRFMSKLDSMQNDCFLCPQDDNYLTKQDDGLAKNIQRTVVKPHSALMRRSGHFRTSPSDFSSTPLSFSFVRLTSEKGAAVGKRTVSPFRLPIKRSESVANRNRSASAKSSANIQRCPSEPRKAVAIIKNPDANRGKELELYSRKSKNLFKALLSIHRSRKQGVPVPYRFRDDK